VGLRKLIEECWSAKPQDRPSFQHILRRFETGSVFFEKADQGVLEKYFQQIRDTRWQPDSVTDDRMKQLVTLFQDKSKEAEQVSTLKTLIEDPKAQSTVRELIDLGLIEKLTPTLASMKNPSQLSGLIELLLTLFKDPQYGRQYVAAFTQSGGMIVLTTFMGVEAKQKLGFKILEAIQAIVPRDAAIQLLSTVIEQGRFDLAASLVANGDSSILPILGSFLTTITKALSKPEDKVACARILEIYVDRSDSIADLMKLLKFRDVLKIGSIPLLRALMLRPEFLAIFQSRDAVTLCQRLVEGVKGEKECAMLLALGLGPDFFGLVAQYPILIKAALSTDDKDLSFRFMVRLCRFPGACEFYLTQSALFEQNFSNPWILTALSRIAGYFPSDVAKLPFLRAKLLANLDQGVQIEAVLRLTGVLSEAGRLWDDPELPKALFQLLRAHGTTPLETKLLLSVLANIASFVPM
jgi:hypothetical protein